MKRLVTKLDRSPLRWILFLVVLVVLFFVFASVWPKGPDYYGTFRPVTEYLIRGETQLYDHKGYGYFNAPWGILLIAPTLLLPPNYGQSLIILATLLGLFFAIYAVNRTAPQRKNEVIPLIAILLAVANLHTFDLLHRGNLDGAILVGIGLSWYGYRQRKPFLLGIGLCLLAIKPMNIILAAVVIIWAIRSWSKEEKLKVLVPGAVLFLLSLVVIGYDWPVRYFQFVDTYPPLIFLQTSLWRAVVYFGFPQAIAYLLAIPVLLLFVVILLRTDIERHGELLLGLALAINLFISPYSLGSHFVLLAPVFVLLVIKSRWFLLLWLVTLTPLLRLSFGFEIAWADTLYPMVVMIILFVMLTNKHAKDKKQNKAIVVKNML